MPDIDTSCLSALLPLYMLFTLPIKPSLILAYFAYGTVVVVDPGPWRRRECARGNRQRKQRTENGNNDAAVREPGRDVGEASAQNSPRSPSPDGIVMRLSGILPS